VLAEKLTDTPAMEDRRIRKDLQVGKKILPILLKRCDFVAGNFWKIA
jgi:hypothetical protein